MKLTMRGIAVFVGLTLTVASCSGDDDSVSSTPGASAGPSTSAGPVAPTGTLTVGLERDPERLDPNFARHVVAETVGQALFDSLIYVSKDGQLVPGLATSFSFSNDTTLNFVLRKGVEFHNGEPFNAASVKFSVERMQDKKVKEGSHLLGQFAAIASVDVVDDYNVTFRLSRPDANLLYALTRLMMMPPVYVDGVGTKGIEQKPIGTGPFKFVSYTVDSRTVVEANTKYWSDSPKGRPLVQQVVFRVIPETTTRVAELTTGGIQIAKAITAQQKSVITNAGLSVLSTPDGKAITVIINAASKGKTAASATGGDAVAFKALSDVRVRQALNYAIDRDSVIKNLLDGESAALGQPWGPGGFGYDPNNKPYPYDPKKARALLTEAGYPNGFTVDFVAANTANIDEVNVIVGYLAGIGIKVDLEIIDPGVSNERLLAQVWAPVRYQTWNQPETFLDLLAKTDGQVSAYSSPKVDALIEKQRITVNPEERTKVLAEITSILREEPMAIYLWSTVARVGLDDKRTSGFKPHVNGWIPVTDVSIKAK